MAKKNSHRIKLAIIKERTLKLRRSYQLPYELCKRIYLLKIDDGLKYVTTLVELTNHYLRVAGYYKKYPQSEKQANDDIKKLLTDMGY